VAGAVGLAAAACAGPGREAARRREADLHRQGAEAVRHLLTVDLHAHPGAFHRPRTGELPLGALEDMRLGGVDAALFAVSTDGPVLHREPGGRIHQVREPEPGLLYREAASHLSRVEQRIAEGRLALVRTGADLAAARARGVPGALLAFEGGDALEGRPERVREFHARGLRSIQLVHYRINELGDIQTEPSRHGGLTAAGAAVVAELNRLGMLVDGAHASHDTLRGILEVSRDPILVSHTGAAALRPDVRRHLPDELFRAVAARGGLIGLWPLARAGEGLPELLAELDHVRRLVGIEHVGVATDLTGLRSTSIPTHRHFAPLPAALLAHGFSEAEVRAVLGGNFARLLEAVAGA
jgi:membrane dipeptidase